MTVSNSDAQGSLTLEETHAEFERAFRQEYENRPRGSLSRFTFHAHFYAGEADLRKRGLLDLFRKSQTLPEYQRAQDAIRRGWSRWIQQEFSIEPERNTDPLTVRQFLLLYQLRFTVS